MKFALPFVLCLVFVTTGCNTLENNRSLYSPKKGDGPYTRSLQDGTWRQQRSIDEQYAEGKRGAKGRAADEDAPTPAVEPKVN